MRRSSASPAHPSRRRTRTRGRSSAITSASTTSSAPSPTRPRCRSTTRAAFDSLIRSSPHDSLTLRAAFGSLSSHRAGCYGSRPRSVGLRPTRCVFYLLRYAPPSGCLRLAISGFASGSVAPLGSFGSKLALNAAELPKLDAEFEEITEGGELTKKESRAAWDAARQTERSAARRSRGARLHQPKDVVGRAGGAGGRSETHRAGSRRSGGAFDFFAPGLVGLRPTLRVVCLTQPPC